jgi:hypothetical protein
MNIHKLLVACDPGFKINEYKVHLASWNGVEEPRDVFASGIEKWKIWQECQSKKNFERKYIISLIDMPGEGEWLFAGLWKSNGVVRENERHFFYSTELLDSAKEFIGKVVVRYNKSFRQCYPYAETILEETEVVEILREKYSIGEFKGFGNIDFSFSQLEYVINNEISGYKAALSSCSGVYLITDTGSNKIYIGSAYGAGGIWQRWKAYVQSLHGGNKELKKILRNDVEGHLKFRFSILQTLPLDMNFDDIIKYESLWKDRLLSRINGLNGN